MKKKDIFLTILITIFITQVNILRLDAKTTSQESVSRKQEKIKKEKEEKEAEIQEINKKIRELEDYKQKITESQLRIEHKMKEKEIEILKLDKDIKELEISKQKNIKNSLIVISILILILVFLISNLYRFKSKANKYLKKANKELATAYKKMDQLARTDPLTKLSNRRDMLEKIEGEKKRFERSRKPFSIILGDIDDFKSINDQHGHQVGDSILESVAKTMRSMIRSQDMVGRWGGEEFIFLLPETDLKGGGILAEKIRRRIHDSLHSVKEKQRLQITMTFGVSAYKKNLDINACIKTADEALLRGKQKGKNCVVTKS